MLNCSHRNHSKMRSAIKREPAELKTAHLQVKQRHFYVSSMWPGEFPRSMRWNNIAEESMKLPERFLVCSKTKQTIPESCLASRRAKRRRATLCVCGLKDKE